MQGWEGSVLHLVPAGQHMVPPSVPMDGGQQTASRVGQQPQPSVKLVDVLGNRQQVLSAGHARPDESHAFVKGAPPDDAWEGFSDMPAAVLVTMNAAISALIADRILTRIWDWLHPRL